MLWYNIIKIKELQLLNLNNASRKRRQICRWFPGCSVWLLNMPGPAKEAEPMESIEAQQQTVSSHAAK